MTVFLEQISGEGCGLPEKRDSKAQWHVYIRGCIAGNVDTISNPVRKREKIIKIMTWSTFE